MFKEIREFWDSKKQEKLTWLIICICFIGSVIVRGILIDYPKVMQVYPDELRYLESARSLFQGRGLQVHQAASGFQNILYSIIIMPALFFSDKVMQIRVICWIHSIVVSSAVFPIYVLADRIMKEKRQIYIVICLFLTYPTLASSAFFMSEVVFLPISMWVVYFIWRIIDTDNLKQRLKLNFGLGVLLYLAYLTKEVALYYLLAYVIICAARIFFIKMNWKQELICLTMMLISFLSCFLLFKFTLFYGMGHSYYSVGITDFMQTEKFLYFCFAVIYNLCILILAFGVFPILLPTALCRTEKHRQFIFFLLLSILIGCVTIAYMINIREDFPSRSPRKHLRYLEPLFIPLVMEMFYCLEERSGSKRKTAAGLGLTAFSVIFLLIGYSVNSGALVDNTIIKYFDYLSRVTPLKIGSLELGIHVQMILFRFIIVFCLAVLFIVFYGNIKIFKWAFFALLIGLNLINTRVVYKTAASTYKITDLRALQMNEISSMMQTLDGNILLVSNAGIESATKLFDTYIDHNNFYYTNINSMISSGVLDDGVVDLDSEYISDVAVANRKLDHADYIIAKDDIVFAENTVEEILDCPLQNFRLYKNLYPSQIYPKPFFPLENQGITYINAEDNIFISPCETKYVSESSGQLVIYASDIPISSGNYKITLSYSYNSELTADPAPAAGVLQIGNYIKGNIVNQELLSDKTEILVENVIIPEHMSYGEIKLYAYDAGLQFINCTIERIE